VGETSGEKKHNLWRKKNGKVDKRETCEAEGGRGRMEYPKKKRIRGRVGPEKANYWKMRKAWRSSRSLEEVKSMA